MRGVKVDILTTLLGVSLTYLISMFFSLKISFSFLALFSAYYIYKGRNDKMITLITFFNFLFYLILAGYFFFDIPYHIYTETISKDRTLKVILHHFIFTNIFISSSKIDWLLRVKSLRIPSSVNFYFITSFLLIILIYLISTGGASVFIDQSYNIDSFGSIWFEYSVAFIIVGFLSAYTSNQKKIMFLINLLFIIIPLLYGRRLPALFHILALMIFSNIHKISQVKFVFMIFFGTLFISLLGLIRDPNSVSISIVNLFFSIDENGIMSNNFGGIVVCSTSYLYLSEIHVFDNIWQIKSLLGHFIGIFLPSSFNFPEAFPNTFAMKYLNIPGNGGLISTYLYVWGGIPLMVLTSMVMRWIVFSAKSNNPVKLLVSLLLIVTFPRWFSYNILPVIKLIFWSIILYSLAYTRIKLLKK